MFTNTRVFRQRVPGWLGSRVVSVLVSGTKFGTAVGAADVITCIKFFGDWLGGVDSVGGGRKLPSPTDKASRR